MKHSYKEEDYAEHIKDKCVGRDCKRKLPNTWSYYLLSGNFCAKCNRQANDWLKSNRKQVVKMKKLMGVTDL